MKRFARGMSLFAVVMPGLLAGACAVDMTEPEAGYTGEAAPAQLVATGDELSYLEQDGDYTASAGELAEEDWELLGECGRNDFVGAGSCNESCWRKRDLDHYCPGSIAWECAKVNYEHWRNKNNPSDPGQYKKTGGPYPGYYYCSTYDLTSCPSFC